MPTGRGPQASLAEPVSGITALKRRLREVETLAATLPWAQERPWTRKTHLRWEGDRPVVDLHDLSRPLAEAATRAVLAALDRGDLDQVRLITGKGRRSKDGPVLRGAVKNLIRAEGGEGLALSDEEGWFDLTSAAPATPARPRRRTTTSSKSTSGSRSRSSSTGKGSRTSRPSRKSSPKRTPRKRASRRPAARGRLATARAWLRRKLIAAGPVRRSAGSGLAAALLPEGLIAIPIQSAS